MTQPNASPWTHYTIYGGELSLFTRKLEAALIFYGADHHIEPKSEANRADVEHRSGTHQVPVLHTPENWMIGDTTPLIDLMDARFPARRLFPEGPLGVLTHVVEEFFDEWVARVMVHYRWHYPDSALFASERISGGNAAAAEQIRGWGPRACRATGTESPTQQKAAEDEYLRLMATADEQLGQTKYLLGDRPTAVDCIVLGGLRAHTLMDPDPKKVVSQFARLAAWAEGGADDWSGEGELAPFPESTPFARTALAEFAAHYRPVMHANAEALAAGARAFEAETYGEPVSYLCRPYPIQSRAMVRRRIDACPTSEERSRVESWLASVGLENTF